MLLSSPFLRCAEHALRQDRAGRQRTSALSPACHTDRGVLLALWMLKACTEKEPVRSQMLYFFLMDAHTGEALLLPNACPAHVAVKVSNVTTSSPSPSSVEPVMSSMAALLDSTRYASAGVGIDDARHVFKMYPKKVLNLVSDFKRWDLGSVPARMVRAICKRVPSSMDDSTDAFGFCLDYERRDVAKNILGPSPYMCFGCADRERKLGTCGACGVARYCSAQCQRGDWPAHKHVCEDMKAERERGVVALPASLFEQLWEW